MSAQRVVIVGAGQGGLQVAASLRQDGFEGSIVLIGDEPGLPYQRPPLSKAYLKEGRADRLALRPESFFRQNDIDLVADTVASRIDREARAVETADGRRFDYDHLVLATGGRNAIPPIGGLHLDGVLELRTLAHAEAIRVRLAHVGRVAVIGGGFIGLEFAAVARDFGTEVCVIEAADRLMARVVSPEMSQVFLDLHRAMGTEIRLGTSANGILDDSNGKACGVQLADGTDVAAEMVLIAAGVRPNTDIAEAAGLRIDNGVAVDAQLLTSDPAISAIGDCASFPVAGSVQRVRLESVQAATDHARAVARHIAGDRDAYDEVPWFWSDQGPAKLQIAGLATGADKRICHAPGEGKTVICCFSRERLIGVESINSPRDHMSARKLLALDQAITPEMIEAAQFDLRALLRSL